MNDSSRLRFNKILIAGLLLLLALPAWWSPMQLEDWGHLAWAQSATFWRVVSWLRREHTVGDLVSRLIVVVPWLHAIATPLVYVALCGGVVASAFKLRPTLRGSFPAWTVFVSALVLLSTPRWGQLLWHRGFAADNLYGLAALSWFVALVRILEPDASAPTTRRKLAWLAHGFASGASVYYASTVLLFWMTWLLATRRRPRWLTWGALGLLIGTAAAWLDKPPPAVYAVFNRGLDRNLGIFYSNLGEVGHVIALTAAMGLALAIWRTVTGRTIAWRDLEAPSDIRGFSMAAVAVGLLALGAPRMRHPYQIAIVIPVIAAALPVWRIWVDAKAVRVTAVVLAASAHMLVAIGALPLYWRVHREFNERWELLANASTHAEVTIPPYSQLFSDFFFMGEDLASFGLREQVAIEIFQVRKLEIVSSARAIERSTQLEVEAHWTVVPEDDLDAFVPKFLASDLGVARRQVGSAMRALVAAGRTVQRVEVVVRNLDFPERQGRDIIAAWGSGKTLRFSSLRARNPDPRRRIFFSINRSALGDDYSEVWVVAGKASRRVTQETDGMYPYSFPVLALEPHFVVLCSSRSCALAGVIQVGR
ncbi:MAG: hypothetical protein R3B48_12045 [Kofleriaceae bacterium]